MKSQIQNNQQIQQNISNQNILNINRISSSKSQLIGSCINQCQIDQSSKNNQIYQFQNSEDQIHDQKPNDAIDQNLEKDSLSHDRQELSSNNLDNSGSSQKRKSDSYHQNSGSQNIFQNSNAQQQNNLDKNEDKMQKQHLQAAYRFYQNYYKQKLMPFYRTFNIDPYIKDSSKTKYFKSNKNQKNQIIDYVSRIKQFQQIKRQLQQRMIPVIEGIQCFVGSIIQKKYFILKNMQFLIKQNISKTINQRLSQLERLALNAYNKIMNFRVINIQQKNLDFMQYDLLRCIHEFLKLISSQLNPNVMFIIQSIFIIFLDIIINFYHTNNTSDKLRVYDINQFYQKLQVMILKKQKYKFNFIDDEDLIQLLRWFISWTMVKQLMYNKFNLDFLADIPHQIGQINSKYQQNVKKYVQYKEAIQKQSENNKKIKKQNKIIKKRMLQELRKQQNIEFFEKQGYHLKAILKDNTKNFIQNIEKINKENLLNNKLHLSNKKNFDNKSESHHQLQYYSNISNDQYNQKILQKINQQTQYWNKRLEQSFQIIKNPISFKQNYKQRVLIQRSQVQQLLFANKKSSQDPFVIKKNYRKKGLLYSSSNQFIQSYENQDSDNENHAQNQSKQRFQQSQEMY